MDIRFPRTQTANYYPSPYMAFECPGCSRTIYVNQKPQSYGFVLGRRLGCSVPCSFDIYLHCYLDVSLMIELLLLSTGYLVGTMVPVLNNSFVQ